MNTEINLIDVDKNLIIRKYNVHSDHIVKVAFSNDNNLMLTSGLDQKVFLIYTFSGKVFYELKNDYTTLTLGFSKCGN